MIVTPLSVTIAWSLTVPSTLPPFWRGHVDDHADPDFIEATISAVMIRGAGRPGISAVVMMMSTSAAWSAYSCGLERLVVLAHLLGVAGRRDLDLGRLDREVLTTQRLHLVGDLGTRVGRAHDRTQRARRTDRGQTRRHPAPTTSTLAGGTLPAAVT